jgi:hypothetical protein
METTMISSTPVAFSFTLHPNGSVTIEAIGAGVESAFKLPADAVNALREFLQHEPPDRAAMTPEERRQDADRLAREGMLGSPRNPLTERPTHIIRYMNSEGEETDSHGYPVPPQDADA